MILGLHICKTFGAGGNVGYMGGHKLLDMLQQACVVSGWPGAYLERHYLCALGRLAFKAYIGCPGRIGPLSGTIQANIILIEINTARNLIFYAASISQLLDHPHTTLSLVQTTAVLRHCAATEQHGTPNRSRPVPQDCNAWMTLDIPKICTYSTSVPA